MEEKTVYSSSSRLLPESTNLKTIQPRNLKLLPQSTIKMAFLDDRDPRNAIWDMFVTRSGRCFFSVCAELDVCVSAGLYEYVAATGEIKCCFELDEKICNAPDSIMPSKIHTSISEMEDGRLIMTTHTTAQSRVHPYWHPEPFYNHTFEGYQGSNIIIYDPSTGALENRGKPVPHESIYGGTYDPKKKAFYFTGYFRGHLYRYDVETGKTRDYGKVTEFGTFRLYRSEIDGNIYSASRSGRFYRINTDTQEIEELGIFFPKDYEPYSTDKHVQIDYLIDGPDGNLYLRYIFGYNLYRYNIKENKLECVGDPRPKDLELSHPNQQFGMEIDENGVIWYVMSTSSAKYDWTVVYLVRWDLFGGGTPRNMGILGTPRQSVSTMAEMKYHDGIMYFTNGNHNFDTPGMVSVDIRKLDSLDYNLDEENEDTPYSYDVQNYLHIDNPEKIYPYGEEEFARRFESCRYFRDYMVEYADFLNKNDMELKGKKVTAYPFWREYGHKNSPVWRVYYENGKPVAEFGGEKKYRYRDGKVEEINEFTKREAPVSVPADRVPAAKGRNFKAVPTVSAEIWDGKHLVGTQDGILFVWDGEFAQNFGACPNTSGEVRDICYCEKTETAYGVIGSYNDIGIVFSFNKREGVKYLGRAYFNIDTGLHINCELSCIAVSEDGKRIVIGSNENMGTMYEIEL